MVKTRHDVVVAKAIVTGEKHAPVVWRPPGKSEGQAVTDHRHLHGPPVPPSTDAVRNLRNETDLAALLAAAHVQLGEQRQHAALAAEEARHRLTMLRAEHASELLQLGSALELERRAREAAEQREVALTAKFADTREGRVDEYHKRAMRRMLRSELSRAWSQWLAVYEQKLYARVIARRTQAALLVFMIAYNLAAVGLAASGHMNPLFAAVLMPLRSLATLVIVWMGLRRAG
jgi:hypothetical protein